MDTSWNKSCYTLRCTGAMDGYWLAGFLKIFQDKRVNIRTLTYLPSFESGDGTGVGKSAVHFRMEVRFDLPSEGDPTFLAGVQRYLDTLPQARQTVLQPVLG